ncbi:MAG: glycosyltransferase family 4 protein [Butyrivibrio sp.]|nr:glycosyltransferase family 4 protein [Butyrivibrio sp.]
MKVVFVSNYINHHQMPFCNEMARILGGDFSFVEVSPMDEERIKMGWNSEKLPYVHRIYEEEELSKRLIRKSDIMLLGWIGDDKNSPAYIETRKRLMQKKPSIRISERIYREGRWKMFSPRGLMAKYDEHIRFRKENVHLLCAGAYVSGDFKAIGAYPHKMYKWGYFPPFTEYSGQQIDSMLYRDGKKINICFAGRLIRLKHPELVVKAAKTLKEKGIDFCLHIVGDGNRRSELEKLIADSGLYENVIMHGALPPSEVRQVMEMSHIMVFSSNYLEGWGAVVNEAMNSLCAVVASSEAGAVPFLIRENENGMTFDNCSLSDLTDALYSLCTDPEKIRHLQLNAYETIRDKWNANIAAKRLISFCEYVLNNGSEKGYDFPLDGPLSRAEVLRPAGFLRSLSEDNHLE